MALDPAVLEKAYAAERRVALVRGAVIVFNTAIYALFLDKAGTIPWLAWTIIGVANVYAIFVLAAKPYQRFPGMMSVYFTSISDASLIALWILATGNWESPFYVLWYVSIVAVAFRFSLQRTLAVCSLYSVVYVGTLAAGGELLVDLPALGVRLGYIWLVGWLSGLIGQETYQQTRAKLSMKELAEASSEVTEELDLDATVRRVVTAGMRLGHADRGAVFLLDKETEKLRCAHAEGLTDAYLDAVVRNYRELPAAELLRGETAVHVTDVLEDARTAPIREVAEAEGIRAYLVVPLSLYGEPFGALILYRDRPEAFSEEEIGLIRSLGSHAATAIENARLVTELRDSKERWRSLVHHAPNIVMAVDRQGYIRFINRGVPGIPAESVVGTRVVDWVPGPYRETIEDGIRRVFEAGESVTFEVPGPISERELGWYGTRVGPLKEGDRVTGALMIHMDITERKRTEEELRRSNADLEQFAYVASHDLQEPLRMIASYVQLLERRYADQLDEEAGEYIQYAVEGAQRMQTLIKDLLAYSRVDRSEEPMEQVDLDSVVQRVLHDLEATLEEARAKVQVGELPVVLGDAPQLQQVFQNLISNAVKFRGERDPRVLIEAHRDDEGWVISVEDNGIGIDPSYRDKVFNLFQRLNPRDKYPGTGIGLAICKKVVERHDGRIWVEPVGDPKAPAGSRFSFTLKPPSRGARPPPSRLAEPSAAEEPASQPRDPANHAVSDPSSRGEIGAG